MEVHARIQHVREKAGLSKAELARAVGVTRCMVTLYEQGRATPRFRTLERICKATKHTVPEFWALGSRARRATRPPRRKVA